MTIKHITTLTLLTLSLAACSEEAPRQSELAERAASAEPILTSTVTTAPVERVEPEPSEKAEPEGSTPAEPQVEPVQTDTPSFEPLVETVDGVTLQRFVTTSAIERREPTDPTSTFGPQHDKVYAFVEVSNESELDKSLFVHFIGPKGKVSGGIELDIPAAVPRWRTWAYTRHFAEPGLWRVEIRDADGTLLGALPFDVEPGF